MKFLNLIQILLKNPLLYKSKDLYKILDISIPANDPALCPIYKLTILNIPLNAETKQKNILNSRVKLISILK